MDGRRGFNVDIVINGFSSCKKGDLLIDDYIKAYDEICAFFNMLGTVFGFINSDILEKLGILLKYREEESTTRDNYETVTQMFEFEISLNKETNQPLLGSRTLLRLHRALAFTMLFMERLSVSCNSEKTSALASDAYIETLAKFHPWLIRKAAQMAMYTLPSRGDMLKMLANSSTESEVQEKLKTCVEAIRPVYDSTEELYTKYDLHGLP